MISLRINLTRAKWQTPEWRKRRGHRNYRLWASKHPESGRKSSARSNAISKINYPKVRTEGDADVPAFAGTAGIVHPVVSDFMVRSAAAEADPLAMLLRGLYIHRGGPVTRLADMTTEKQAAMRRMYAR